MHLPRGLGLGAGPLMRASIVVAAFVALGLVVSACGGGSPGVASLGSTRSTSAPTVQGTATQSKGEAAVIFSRCMRSHGVPNFPTPVETGNHVSLTITPAIARSPRFRSAQAHCRELLPHGGEGPTITPADQADYLRGTACMRSHGYPNFPDPTISDDQVRFVVPASINQNSQQFRRAVQTCERLIPAGLPYSDNGGS